MGALGASSRSTSGRSLGRGCSRRIGHHNHPSWHERVSDDGLRTRRVSGPGGRAAGTRRHRSSRRRAGFHYGTYHAFLRDELAKIGPAPHGAALESLEVAFDQLAWAHDYVKAEVLLRNCRAFVLEGRALDELADLDGPSVLDAEYGLVSVES
jgi:hypothetical protein